MAGNIFSARLLLNNLLHTPALAYRDLRFLGISGVFHSSGISGESVLLGWVVLELTDSPLMVAVAFGLRLAPSFFFGLIAGAIADNVNRRLLLRTLELGMAGVGVGVGLLILFDLIQVWHLLVLSFLSGSILTIYQTLNQSFAYDIVGAKNVIGGLALVSLGGRSGGIIGSLAAGFILGAYGADAAYMVISSSYILSFLVLMLISSPGEAAPIERQPVLRNLKGFLIEIRRNNALLTLTILTAAVEVLGFSHMVLMPSIARDVLNVGEEGLGIFGAIRSAGGMTSLVALSAFGEIQRKGAAYIGALIIFGGAIILLGFSTNFAVAIIAILLISAMAALSDILSQSLIQTVVPNELRGRAMGSWVLATGMGPLGNLQVGALAASLTVTIALTTNGLGLITLAALSFVFLPRLRKL